MKRGGAIHSMTGYGRAAARVDGGAIAVELRSTNHRYLEIDARLPAHLSSLQGRVAEAIRAHVRRGRVEASVTVQLDHWQQRRVVFDESLLARYHEALLELKARFGLKGPVTLEQLLALPQAVAVSEERMPTERLWGPMSRTVESAARELIRSRRREGAKLAADLRRQTRAIEQHAQAIRRRLPKALAEQRRRLQERLRELLGTGVAGSTAQLEQVAALVKDADVHEELVRIASHLAHMRETLSSRQLVGKRLDFIAQELMREVNTLGAKVNDPAVVQRVVEVKGAIEKIREQVQNLE